MEENVGPEVPLTIDEICARARISLLVAKQLAQKGRIPGHSKSANLGDIANRPWSDGSKLKHEK
jgi:hypothetical protein